MIHSAPEVEQRPLTPLQDSCVYGPIRSRRLGDSLGINPLPVSYKFCDFDCVYCQYGWTPSKGTGERLKRAPELLREIEAAFVRHKELETPVDCITMAGNGEPAIHPDFPELVRGLLRLRGRYYPGVKIGILSDSSQAHRPEIREALALLDERYMKLDAGTPELFRKINRPRGDFDFSRMIRALETMEDIVIQSLFMQGSHDNTRPADVEKWAEALGRIRPREVQVYTVDRGPADPGLRIVPEKRLREIAALCRRKTGIKAVVYD